MANGSYPGSFHDRFEGGPDLGSIFLGPKGENADVFERLLLEAFRDHVFWRRNYHPEDGFLVREVEKRTPAFEHSISVLSQELLGLLAELKGGVPFFSPRYIGHMAADLTMASLIGYFATMLYNPNNVVYGLLPVVQGEVVASDGGGVRLQSYIRPLVWSAPASGP